VPTNIPVRNATKKPETEKSGALPRSQPLKNNQNEIVQTRQKMSKGGIFRLKFILYLIKKLKLIQLIRFRF